VVDGGGCRDSTVFDAAGGSDRHAELAISAAIPMAAQYRTFNRDIAQS
jgi:hypothetical protein